MNFSNCEEDISMRLKRRAVENGKIFSIKIPKTMTLPGDQCGFKRTIENRKQITGFTETDYRAVVSLALTQKQSEILGTYANKLPIMTMNVSRYLYTVEAFVYRDYKEDASAQAIDFLISTDIKYRSDYIDSQNRCQPNLEFSKFLHRLRSCGYCEYIFELARHLSLNVDLVFSKEIVIRYFLLDSVLKKNNTAVGFLTAITNGDKWYVKTTKNPLVTDSFTYYK